MQRQQPMDGVTGNQHLAERTCDQKWRQRALTESEAEAEAKREVDANYEEVKQRGDKR